MDDQSPGPGQGFDENLAERLAEDAFAKVSPPKTRLLESHSTELLSQPQSISRGATGTSNYVRPVLYEPQPKRPDMVSTGTMTSPSPPRSPPHFVPPPQSQKLTTPPSSNSTHDRVPETYIRQEHPQRPALLDVGRSQTHVIVSSTSQPSSSRPSLEMSLSSTDAGELTRSKSANAKSRPHSVYVESNLEFLRDLDSPSSQGTSTGGFPPIAGLQLQHSGRSVSSMRSEHIDSNVDFLRAMEAEADANKPERRNVASNFVGKHVKRASMPSITLPKNKLGKFGDAFRRFERGSAGNNSAPEPVRGPSPDTNYPSNGVSSIDDEWEVSSQDIPPEVKRELEKRQLSQEEKRVAAAAAEYKRQLASRAEGEPVRPRNRANSIQKRVHALLNETNKEPPPKTAEGYGRYTAEASVPQAPNGSSVSTSPVKQQESYRITQSSTGYRPSTPVPATATAAAAAAAAKVVRNPLVPAPTPTLTRPTSSSSTTARPPPPPKPKKLRTGGGSNNSSPVIQQQQQQPDEDWERNFAKRYPSLSGLEISDGASGGSRKG